MDLLFSQRSLEVDKCTASVKDATIKTIEASSLEFANQPNEVIPQKLSVIHSPNAKEILIAQSVFSSSQSMSNMSNKSMQHKRKLKEVISSLEDHVINFDDQVEEIQNSTNNFQVKAFFDKRLSFI